MFRSCDNSQIVIFMSPRVLYLYLESFHVLCAMLQSGDDVGPLVGYHSRGARFFLRSIWKISVPVPYEVDMHTSVESLLYVLLSKVFYHGIITCFEYASKRSGAKQKTVFADIAYVLPVNGNSFSTYTKLSLSILRKRLNLQSAVFLLECIEKCCS